MSLQDHELWEQLADREAEGEPLSAEQQADKRRLEARYPEFARETELYRTLEHAVDLAAPPAPADDRLIQTALGVAGGTIVSRQRNIRRRLLFVATIAATIAAVAVLSLRFASNEPVASTTTNAAHAPNAAPRATLLRAADGVTLNGKPARAGAALHVGSVVQTASGTACVELERGVVACAAPNSRFTLTALGRRQELELGAGHVSAVLDPQPTGTHFAIATRAGVFAAQGTIFGVELQPAGTAVVRVEEGAVVARSAEGEVLVRQGQQFQLGHDSPRPLPSAELERDAALLATPAAPSPKLESRLSAARRAVIAHATVPASAQPINDTANALPRAAARRAANDDLLTRAGDARARGAFAEAAQQYERLLRERPASPAGRTALIALAELRLSKLGQPAAALELYDRYLSGAGSLTQEAHYGKIRALRALGRSSDERREVAAFLERFPSSAYANSLRKRLQAP